MRYSYTRFVIIIVLIWSSVFVQAQQLPGKDNDRFAGLHFDFHAGLTDSGIGKTFTPAMIDSFLTIVQPDFIQVDCKGHPGISSYPTKVGNPAPAFAKDIMKIWRDETSKYKVPLYVHYSGLWDNRALQLHPQWARYNADGKPDNNATSLFGGYADSLLIPQLKELATVYHLDGVWVDGDCWYYLLIIVQLLQRGLLPKQELLTFLLNQKTHIFLNGCNFTGRRSGII